MLTTPTTASLDFLTSPTHGSITFAHAMPMGRRWGVPTAHHAASENPLPARGALGRRAPIR